MSGIHNSPNDVDLGRLFASLAAIWLRILMASIFVAGLALAFAGRATPLYKAETRLLIENRPNVSARTDPRILDEEGVTGQMEVVGSNDILKQVARKLDLSTLPEFDKGGKIPVLDSLLVKAGLLSDPAEMSPEEHVLKAMRQKLSVYRVEGTRVIGLEFSSEDPRLAAEIPNALVDAYMAVHRDVLGTPVDARALSRAVQPKEPYFPKSLPIAGVAFAATLLIVASVTLLRERLSRRALGQAASTRLQPIAEVVMPERAMPGGDDAPVATPRFNIARKAREPRLLAGRGEINIETAAERLIGCGAARAIFVSPEGDEAAATAVLVAREVADSGLRVLLLDLTLTGAASRPMLESRFHLGITNLLASEAQFSQVIHADRYSDCHVIPRGTADPERAMRAVDRLPIIMNSLTMAYDLVVVECGPSYAEGIRRLVSDGTEILVSMLEAEGAVIAEAMADLVAAGYWKLTLVSPAGYGPPVAPMPNRSAA